MIADNPLLPPDGEYVSPTGYHEYVAMGIVLTGPSHKPILDRGGVERKPDADGSPLDEIEIFPSVFRGTVVGLGIITLEGPVTVRTSDRYDSGGSLNETGTFATEILSMSLTGNTPVGFIIIREDPARASTGETTITDLSGGLYQIDSFFDVFTELSLDGGAWIPSDNSTRMTLTPEPTTMGLLCLGALGLLRRRRAKSKR